MTDSNGYNPSILDTEQGTCYICGCGGDTVRHEIYSGIGNRSLSKKYGCWCNLCVRCHELVHSNRPMNLKLKRDCQSQFEYKFSHKEFMRIFMKSYL